MTETRLDLDKIQIERPFYNQQTFQTRYSFRKLKINTPIRDTKNYLKKKYKPSRNCFKVYINARLPVINLFRKYNIKDNLFKDIVGGLTIGIVQIPRKLILVNNNFIIIENINKN